MQKKLISFEYTMFREPTPSKSSSQAHTEDLNQVEAQPERENICTTLELLRESVTSSKYLGKTLYIR